MRRWMALSMQAATWVAVTSTVHAAPVDDVLAADRAFAALARVKGARTAFTEFADPQAVMFRAGVGPVKGIDAIGRAFEDPPAAAPVWEPEAAEVAASGDLAYTWGPFTWTPVPDGPLAGKPPLTGYYVSIWKKQPDGRWKWVVDLGVPAPKKP
ncbi:MAG: YybH family protein [Burkholderiaceae bacterium]